MSENRFGIIGSVIALLTMICLGLGIIRSLKQTAYDDGWFKGYSEASEERRKEPFNPNKE